MRQEYFLNKLIQRERNSGGQQYFYKKFHIPLRVNWSISPEGQLTVLLCVEYYGH